jgi:hypothetical protein
MLKPLSNLYVRVIISAAVGFFFVGAFTNNQYPCTQTIPGEDISHCVSIESAIMHPRDLIHNKQASLTRFSKTFAIVSLGSFALLSIISLAQKKKT